MRHFAEHGFQDARVSDIADELGIAKGSVFQHFGSKNGLFFEAYKKAVRSFPSCMHAPADVLRKGFFETLRYWLVRTEHLVHEDWIPYRVSLLGNHGTEPEPQTPDQPLPHFRRPIRHGRLREDGPDSELRSDIDLEMMVAILDWTMERFQDALLTEELDPGLFRRNSQVADKKEARIEQLLEVLRGAIGRSLV